MANETREEKSSVEFVCRYSGEGGVKAKFVFGEQEYTVSDESGNCRLLQNLSGYICLEIMLSFD